MATIVFYSREFMRWILVFIVLYLVPLVVIFSNYSRLSRACIYSCVYVALITTLVVSNMYISNLRKIENDILASTRTNYCEVCVSTFEQDERESDLAKIRAFKRDISDIEAVAVRSFNECVGGRAVDLISLKSLAKLDKEIDKALYMCERVIEAYEDMEVPILSRDEYNLILEECVDCMKEAYEIRYRVVKEVDGAIRCKDVSRIANIKSYMSQADEKINQYKIKIFSLESSIKGK